MLSDPVHLELQVLGKRGSDRDFFRVTWSRHDSAILIHYSPDRPENAYHAEIALFLNKIRVPVPRLISHDPSLCLMLVEDLGETDLWSLREKPWETRQELYRKTLTVVHRLHSFPEKDLPLPKVRLMEAFGPQLYRWERDYFREHFVRGVCAVDLEPSLEAELEKELTGLASRLGAAPHCLVHRDLQSQNVMIRNGEPFLIDFQGMRFGNPFYDLGSLLYDPYVRFSDEERESLLLFYYALTGQVSDLQAFRSHFREASVQRLMQALGAYGFLGMKKGIVSFLDHIPPALANLHRAASQAASLPRLLHVTELCREAMRRVE
jgi:hypothetical protein